MADFSFTPSTIPSVIINGEVLRGHHLVAKNVISGNSLLEYIFSNGVLDTKDFMAGNGVLLSSQPGVADSLGGATHLSSHLALRGFEAELFKPLQASFNAQVDQYTKSGLSDAQARAIAGAELAPDVMGYQNVLRNGAAPFLNDNGQFLNFQGDVLTPAEVQAGGWFTPLYQNDPIYVRNFGSMPLRDYYAGIDSSTWASRIDFRLGQIGEQLPPDTSPVPGDFAARTQSLLDYYSQVADIAANADTVAGKLLSSDAFNATTAQERFALAYSAGTNSPNTSSLIDMYEGRVGGTGLPFEMSPGAIANGALIAVGIGIDGFLTYQRTTQYDDSLAAIQEWGAFGGRTTGSLTGMLIGGAIAGPPGAIIGGFAGAYFGDEMARDILQLEPPPPPPDQVAKVQDYMAANGGYFFQTQDVLAARLQAAQEAYPQQLWDWQQHVIATEERFIDSDPAELADAKFQQQYSNPTTGSPDFVVVPASQLEDWQAQRSAAIASSTPTIQIPQAQVAANLETLIDWDNLSPAQVAYWANKISTVKANAGIDQSPPPAWPQSDGGSSQSTAASLWAAWPWQVPGYLFPNYGSAPTASSAPATVVAGDTSGASTLDLANQTGQIYFLSPNGLVTTAVDWSTPGIANGGGIFGTTQPSGNNGYISSYDLYSQMAALNVPSVVDPLVWDNEPGAGGGTGSAQPVVLDLTGNGINITQLTSSNQFFDMTGDGYQNRTAWAGAGNGVLVLDQSGTGDINTPMDFEFTLWDSTATSDMQALEDVFDTNHDGELDAGDADWNEFGVLVTNANGTTTFETLNQLGITSINLTTDNTDQALADGSQIVGETTYTKSDGTTGTVADASFAYDSNGYATQQTVTTNDGSTSIDVKAFNSDGSLANETISTTSADGLTVTLQYDHTGNGLFDQTQTDVTQVNADGSRTVTASNYDVTGALMNRTTTTTSADRKTVTIDRDLTGGRH